MSPTHYFIFLSKPKKKRNFLPIFFLTPSLSHAFGIEFTFKCTKKPRRFICNSSKRGKGEKLSKKKNKKENNNNNNDDDDDDNDNGRQLYYKETKRQQQEKKRHEPSLNSFHSLIHSFIYSFSPSSSTPFSPPL